MSLSWNERYLGLAVGVKHIKDISEVLELHVYEKNYVGHFKLRKRQAFKFPEASPRFVFRKSNQDEMLFLDRESIFSYNYMLDTEKTVVYEIENSFDKQPVQAMFSADQDQFIATTYTNCLMVDMKHQLEVDVDDNEEISNITNIIYGENQFYVMANKKCGKLGYFLFSLDTNDPEAPAHYFLNWSNRLDIADCDMALMMDKNTRKKTNMVVSYKNIGINTYNVFVYNLKTKLIMYNFEAN